MHVKGTAACVCKKSMFFFIACDEPHHANDEVCARFVGYTIFYLKHNYRFTDGSVIVSSIVRASNTQHSQFVSWTIVVLSFIRSLFLYTYIRDVYSSFL